MPNRAALFMIAYAVAMVFLGTLAYTMAPPGASSLTALIIPSVCAVFMIACAVLAWRIRADRTLGMIGVHVGLVLPLVFGAAFFMTAGSRFVNAGKFAAALDTVEAVAAQVPADAPGPESVYYLTSAEIAEQREAAARGDAGDGEKILARAQERRATVESVITTAIETRGLVLTETQRRHAEGAVALIVADNDRFPSNDQAYLGRILAMLFGVSLMAFMGILLQRGSASSELPVAKPAPGKTEPKAPATDTGRDGAHAEDIPVAEPANPFSAEAAQSSKAATDSEADAQPTIHSDPVARSDADPGTSVADARADEATGPEADERRDA